MTRASCESVSKAPPDGGIRAAHLGADGLGVILALLGGHCDDIVCRFKGIAGWSSVVVGVEMFEGEENRKYHLHNGWCIEKWRTILIG
jgi:hypothetical protein